jgi:translation initiation factor 2 beta subunit (eIF-2beta)/eIF-5
MVAPNPLAARRRTNSSSFSVAVPSSWEESVVSGAIANRFAISRPLLNLKGDQTTIDQTSDIPQAGHRMEARSLQLDKASPEKRLQKRM